MSDLNNLGELPNDNSKNPLVIKPEDKDKKKGLSEVLLDMHEVGKFSPDDALKELKNSFRRLEKITKKYKKVKFDLAGLEQSVRVSFKAMVKQQDKEVGWIYRTLKLEGLEEAPDVTYMKEREMEIKAFRANYMKWVKNLISDFNRYKLVYKWEWLDVKFLAAKLTELKIE